MSPGKRRSGSRGVRREDRFASTRRRQYLAIADSSAFGLSFNMTSSAIDQNDSPARTTRVGAVLVVEDACVNAGAISRVAGSLGIVAFVATGGVAGIGRERSGAEVAAALADNKRVDEGLAAGRATVIDGANPVAKVPSKFGQRCPLAGSPA